VIKVAILTISDSAASGQREDISGPALRERCEAIGWQVVATEKIPDDAVLIAAQLQDWADEDVASLILTTGGTGVSPRDNTPEATRYILEREAPGLAELMRAKGLEQTPFAALSRAVAGIRKRSLIVNLPGAPKGALFSLAAIEHLLPHAVELLRGKTAHA
jgi:molybdenum cofactor synthesis domain-containing protein